MEDTKPNKTTESSLSRRELLKTLTAGGGALVASALLPDEWTSPVVQSGVLPAHAQSTFCPTIFIKDILSCEIGDGIECSDPENMLVYVNWSPSWSTHPVDIVVQWCNSVMNVVNITYNPDGPPYYSAVVEFSLPELIGCAIFPIPVRVTVTFSRDCVASADTTYGEED
jgi:hypothetical protein